MKSIDEDIKTGQFQNIYLLYGEEAYLKRQYKEKLLKAMVTEGDTMNFSAYEGKDIAQGELIDLAETLPFFASSLILFSKFLMTMPYSLLRSTSSHIRRAAES